MLHHIEAKVEEEEKELEEAEALMQLHHMLQEEVVKDLKGNHNMQMRELHHILQ
jgi:hypothetical protein